MTTARTLRSLILALFIFGAIGVGVELVLLEHFEKLWQRLPLVLIVAALLALCWRASVASPRSLRAFQLTMLAFIASGFIGMGLHHQGNLEFEREMYPALGGVELLVEALQGAFPALAPGAMIQLGLLGMAYTFRHPGLLEDVTETQPENGE